MTPAALKAERTRLGLTQKQLATALCVSEQSVSDWECGRKPCALPGLLRLALAQLHHLAVTGPDWYAAQERDLVERLLEVINRPPESAQLHPRP